MPTKRATLFFTLLAITGISIFMLLLLKSFPTSLPALASRLEAEREVYFTLLANERVSDGIYPIVEYTTLGELQEWTSKGFARFIADGLPEIRRETLVDFQKNNERPYPVKDYLPIAPIFDMRLINPAENLELRWWMSFSRIGFDPSLTQAVVFVEDYAGCNAGTCSYGTGNFILLQKIDGKWIIQNYLDVWHLEAGI